MTITARFASWCPRCHQHIEAGERVEWNPGDKARHLNCQSAPAIQQHRIEVEAPAAAPARMLTHRQANQLYFVQNQRAAANRRRSYEEIFGDE